MRWICHTMLQLGRSRWMAQARVLLAGFGMSAAALYLSAEIAGKIAAHLRSSYTQ